MSDPHSPSKVRGFRLSRRRTSVSLEDAFWEAARTIAATRGTSIQGLIAEIDATRGDNGNLSSAIRTYVLDFYRGRVEGAEPSDEDGAMAPARGLPLARGSSETAGKPAPAAR